MAENWKHRKIWKDGFRKMIIDEKDIKYREGMIKGRIAETLIEELFLRLGYNVFRYGMENTVPGIMELRFSDLPKGYPYSNCYFIVVSKKHIKCLSYNELKEGEEITPDSRNYLGNRKEFELNKNVLIDFCNFAVKFFDNV